MLADTTLVAAQHAAKQGWIAPQGLQEVVRASAADQATAKPTEQTSTIVAGAEHDVKVGAIASVLEASQPEGQPPNVIVEGAKQSK